MEATQNEIVFKLFETYKKIAFSYTYISAENEKGGRDKITHEHKKIIMLEDSFEEESKKLAFK
ncbi:hypothetical protein KO527_13925 [Pseudoalteromonas sp. C2R02]|uniref:hypothetical protein n=1 Tax=Pseudoalteromonas sp. C2R02 TaxID=2841565 RepID=UPI001C08AA7D|nr:hypothetical protein [Pseudoalteromonas sp. C2R02]MBU2970447.1 hypothetical protein [Pseudoalteromonas sp. C2R02]